jgi:hypothetical protein
MAKESVRCGAMDDASGVKKQRPFVKGPQGKSRAHKVG